MALFKRRSLSEDTLRKSQNLGVKCGLWLQNQPWFRYNRYRIFCFGSKHPKRFVAVFLGICLLCIAPSFIFHSTTSPVIQQKDFTKLLQTNSTDAHIHSLESNIDSAMREAQEIQDSLKKIFQKKEISRAESIYILTKGEYLKQFIRITKSSK